MRALGRASIASGLKIALEVAWYLMLLLAAALALQGLVAAFGDPSKARVDLLVSFDVGGFEWTSSERLGVVRARLADLRGVLKLSATSRALVVAWHLMVAPWIAAVLVILFQLRKIIRTLAAGDPFVRSNARRIQLIGLVVIGLEILKTLINLLFSLYLKGNFEIEGLGLATSFRPGLGVMFVGLLVVVLGEVFRLGAEMQEEQALTV